MTTKPAPSRAIFPHGSARLDLTVGLRRPGPSAVYGLIMRARTLRLEKGASSLSRMQRSARLAGIGDEPASSKLRFSPEDHPLANSFGPPPGRHRGAGDRQHATPLHRLVDFDQSTQTPHLGSRHQAARLFVGEWPVRRNADTFRATDRRPSVLAGGEKYP